MRTSIIRNISSRSSGLLLFTILSALTAAAEPVYLSEKLALEFTPDDVFFLVEAGPKIVRRIRATVIPLDADSRKYMVGAKVEALQGTSLLYSILIIGKANQFESIALRQYDSAADPISTASTDELQNKLATRKEVLASYRLQIQSQEESLRRLRQDAEVIGNFGRVMETSDEIERLRADVQGAEKSAQTMETLIRLAASMPAPKNALAREAQLTMQLGELAQAAKNAEGAEMARKVGMEADLREKLSVVEATRFDDFDALQRQLEEVRNQRIGIERLKGVATPSANTTPLPVSSEVEY